LLIVDEVGYMPVDTHRANLFFQAVEPKKAPLRFLLGEPF
jgi:DNA replication protein DnaC